MRSKRKVNEHYYVRRPESKSKLGIICTHLRGGFFEFLTSSSVFSKKRVDLGTRLLIESMVLPARGIVLDLGCGYGPVGIVAAASNLDLHVVMVDVNQRAVRLARENARRNKTENVEVRRGFLYEPVEDMEFDTILCNPPVSAGMKIVTSIVMNAPRYLLENGSFQIVVRTKIGGRRLSAELKRAFGDVEVLSKGSGYRVFLSKKP